MSLVSPVRSVFQACGAKLIEEQVHSHWMACPQDLDRHLFAEGNARSYRLQGSEVVQLRSIGCEQDIIRPNPGGKCSAGPRIGVEILRSRSENVEGIEP